MNIVELFPAVQSICTFNKTTQLYVYSISSLSGDFWSYSQSCLPTDNKSDFVELEALLHISDYVYLTIKQTI